MSPETFSKIESWVLEEKKIVTYRWLAQTLDTSANQAKRILSTFLSESKNRDVNATYLISGFSSAEQKQVVTVIPQHQLEDAKSDFNPITSLHVYSIQLKTPTDIQVIASTDEELVRSTWDQDPSADNPFYLNKYSSISPIEQTKREAKYVIQPTAAPKVPQTTPSKGSSKAQPTQPKAQPSQPKAKAKTSPKDSSKKIAAIPSTDAKPSVAAQPTSGPGPVLAQLNLQPPAPAKAASTGKTAPAPTRSKTAKGQNLKSFFQPQTASDALAAQEDEDNKLRVQKSKQATTTTKSKKADTKKSKWEEEDKDVETLQGHRRLAKKKSVNDDVDIANYSSSSDDDDGFGDIFMKNDDEEEEEDSQEPQPIRYQSPDLEDEEEEEEAEKPKAKKATPPQAKTTAKKRKLSTTPPGKDISTLLQNQSKQSPPKDASRSKKRKVTKTFTDEKGYLITTDVWEDIEDEGGNQEEAEQQKQVPKPSPLQSNKANASSKPAPPTNADAKKSKATPKKAASTKQQQPSIMSFFK